MVRVLRIKPENPDPRVVGEAVEIMRGGGLVVYPTDTVYGLGTDPFNAEAVEKVHRAKRRRGKPLPILLSDPGQAERIAVVTKKARRLMEEFWPGQLTIILEARPTVPEPVTLGTGRVGVRVPDSPVARALAEGLGGAIIGTSANISGAPSPRTAEEAVAQLGDRVDLVLDGGRTKYGVSSTVVDLTSSPPRILRVGPVDPSKLEEVLGRIVIV